MYVYMYVCAQTHTQSTGSSFMGTTNTGFYSPLLHIMGKETVALHADGKNITFMSVTTMTHVKYTKSAHCVLNL